MEQYCGEIVPEVLLIVYSSISGKNRTKYFNHYVTFINHRKMNLPGTHSNPNSRAATDNERYGVINLIHNAMQKCSSRPYDKDQALDVSGNRVRELNNDSLGPYKKLAFVYLGDNFIQTIEEAAFANQPYLEVLDLSQNGCDTLPKSLFQLPYLRTLYLSRNKLTDSVFKMKVTSPLRLLQLAKNKLTAIPNIGVQPSLLNLNVSGNDITSISTEDLAQFCSLKELDLSRNNIRFDGGSCECQTLSVWMKLRQIKVKPDDFYNCTDSPPAPNEDCANVRFSNRTYELFNECSSIIQQEVETEKARSVWILVASCVSVFLFVVFVALFCVHKRNRRRRRKQKEQQQLTANNANTELLNSNLTAGNS